MRRQERHKAVASLGFHFDDTPRKLSHRGDAAFQSARLTLDPWDYCESRNEELEPSTNFEIVFKARTKMAEPISRKSCSPRMLRRHVEPSHPRITGITVRGLQ